MTDAGSLNVAIRYSPSFATARVTLAPGEKLLTASHSLYMRDAAITYEAHMQGGLGSAFKRSFSGQSFFLTTFTGPADRESWIDLSPILAGDIQTLAINATDPIVLTQGNWLAASSGLTLDSSWDGFKTIVGGNHLIAVHLSGEGEALIATYGAIDNFELAAGQSILVDIGHLVAYSDSMQISIQTQGGGVTNSLKSGDMWVVNLTGPGKVWTQSRSERKLAEWTKDHSGN